MSIGYLSLGSNLGDRATYLRRAVLCLDQVQGISIIGKSRIYETKAYGNVPQGNYLNDTDTNL
ncbi:MULTISPECIES: 2-amino-4-hydroxy-6-hydroxymethyldihydropteridine diphosphokinase [Enterococcus]|uniref:2-amino-4-hydroxy-6- hydroxymethyldihydropteridine diphosphokinase n=1 Tax=Enterococcus TaxID=1350 RepID=UPI000CF14D99|nr:2-amino-4-hydroxy-6-hydroxymethyldihydropteridine diphosphokinase [Enterococcus faecium]EGP4846713.1 2-amino-4-hydroxy-6-hydroxymethyldihydropteridine diphosphokinase [Enterococcus faecium]EGP4892452.1 2-amino-4-hydroxy-6-hydroxymethyldihydropteridine diphosphokinase [Enterococcus faecium]EGP4915314.1 2-amino-4-hydroxy-6-hydroxymethyldihydropteridine diphosphokinase [Enterococcus faecium]EGP4917794.1 2-amino-4-hydroxy-6-hydroxymethyldihydropteridine diphosphokinase [Enterococcus faecium]EGP